MPLEIPLENDSSIIIMIQTSAIQILSNPDEKLIIKGSSIFIILS
jgi:hypothetical protein